MKKKNAGTPGIAAFFKLSTKFSTIVNNCVKHVNPYIKINEKPGKKFSELNEKEHMFVLIL
jgi:hypothetical protein